MPSNVYDPGDGGPMATRVVNRDGSAVGSAGSNVLEDVHDDVNHMLQVRQVALAGDTDSITKATTSTNRGGTITLGGTSQAVMAANTSRRLWRFQNTSDTDMRLGIGITPTSTTGYLIPAYSDWHESNPTAVETDAINVLCATTGKTFAATEI